MEKEFSTGGGKRQGYKRKIRGLNHFVGITLTLALAFNNTKMQEEKGVDKACFEISYAPIGGQVPVFRLFA